MDEKPTILFVDDEINFLNGLDRLLRRQRDEWTLSFATSVDEAMNTLASERIDVVVADVNMPVKTGFDLLRELSGADGTLEIPVIILTGSVHSSAKREALELGATDLLSKPVQLEELLARLRSALRLKRYQDAIKNQNVQLERMVRERTLDLEFSRLDIILRLAKAGEFRDEETGNHIVRVAYSCYMIAEAMGLDKDFQERIFISSPLHDLGKIGIPDNILLKPGKLTPEEWVIMRAHTTIGAGILAQVPEGAPEFMAWLHKDISRSYRAVDNPIQQMARSIALNHHEKWGGGGYPQGLSGVMIPLEARIVAISDVFDALRSERPYKRAFSLEKSLEIMREGVGAHFDPGVFDAFESVLDRIVEIQERFSDAPMVATDGEVA